MNNVKKNCKIGKMGHPYNVDGDDNDDGGDDNMMAIIRMIKDMGMFVSVGSFTAQAAG